MRIAGEKASKWSGLVAALVLSLPTLIYLVQVIETTVRIGELQLGYFIIGLLLVGLINVFWVAVVAAVGGIVSFVWLGLRSIGRARD